MATRPAFMVSEKSIQPLEKNINFTFHSGFHITQKQRSIDELHKSILNDFPNAKILEISSKSKQDLGVQLSAFNLKYTIGDKSFSVENIFQSSKVLNTGGPYPDILNMSPKDAKRDPRIKVDLKNGINLQYFLFDGIKWELNPKTAFYDWIYIKALCMNDYFNREIIKYDCFTDIEFNPKKSINCQARSAALYVSLVRHNMLQNVIESKDLFLKIQSPKFQQEKLF